MIHTQIILDLIWMRESNGVIDLII
jgi:hypothetical protein